MLKASLRIMIVAAVCVLALIGIVVREGYERSRPPSATSRDISLPMQTIDPRSLLSGHYVIINLQTTTVVPGDVDPCASFAAVADNTSWVALAYAGAETLVPAQGGAPPPYGPVGAASSRDAAMAIASQSGRSRAGLAARGTAFCSEFVDQGVGPQRHASVQMRLLGVERFYASQRVAERIDALLRTQSADNEPQVFAILNVGRDGRARLKGLRVNREVIELNWL